MTINENDEMVAYITGVGPNMQKYLTENERILNIPIKLKEKKTSTDAPDKYYRIVGIASVAFPATTSIGSSSLGSNVRQVIING